MRDVFLINSSLEVSFDEFLRKLFELNSIRDLKKEVLQKHQNIYSLSNYAELFNSYGQVEQTVVQFIEQMKSCPMDVQNEEMANTCSKRDINGLLGIDFSSISSRDIKKISDDNSFMKWSYFYSKPIDKIAKILGYCKTSEAFISEFENCSIEMQNAGVELFEKAIEKDVLLYPDNKICKDVTPSNGKYSVIELRIYSPVAYRIYYHFYDGICFIGALGKKSGNQNSDIVKAHDLISNLRSNA